MSEHWDQMTQALLDLEQGLRELGLWAAQPPAAQRLCSTVPFCADTLEFESWLQWVFIPRMRGLILRRGRLPAAAGIMPMGEQRFAHLGRRQHALLVLLANIDRLSLKLV